MTIKSPTNRQLRARSRRILWFGVRTIAHVIWWELVLRRILGNQRVRRSATRRYSQIARRFRDLAVSMGGVLIKIGQFISSRVDVLPKEMTDELADLQDEVPPERFEDIRAAVEAELGQPVEEAFAFFDPQVQAAASLGQAHRARLHGGEAVVVKVQRPGIGLIVDTDLAAVRTVLRWIRDYPPLRRRTDVIQLLDEFSRTLYEELDYVLEAENALKFAANFAEVTDVIIPRPYRHLSTRRVLVLEDVEGIKITDFKALAAAGVDRRRVAQRLLDTYLKQIFEDGFFHADPHPGNLFVHPVDGMRNPGLQSEIGKSTQEFSSSLERLRPFRLAFVDFGMTGQVAPNVREQLRYALVGLSLRDPSRIVHAAAELGFFLPNADLDQVERAVEQVFLRFYGMTMSELRHLDVRELHAFFDQFRDLLFQMPIQVPQDYIYLGRTVGILSGMSTNLDPDFNVWAAIQPYAERLLFEETLGEPGEWWGEIGELLSVALRLPATTDRFLSRALADQLVVKIAPSHDLKDQISAMVKAMNRMEWTISFAALLISGVFLIINQYEAWGTMLLVIALLGTIWGWLTGRR